MLQIDRSKHRRVPQSPSVEIKSWVRADVTDVANPMQKPQSGMVCSTSGLMTIFLH